MKLRNIFGKRIMVADGLRLPVSRHFYYSSFAVRGRHDSPQLRVYICEGTPGTGFFVRNTESRSYMRFVAERKKNLKQNPLTLLAGREPNFDKEMARVESALQSAEGDEKRILSSYLDVLALAKEEELLQRIVRAVKDRMDTSTDKSLISVLTHYKSSIAGLEHDAQSAQIDYSTTMSEEQSAKWAKVVEAFHLLVNSRRVWSVDLVDDKPAYFQVFFDMGVFDYIKSPGDTPVMRNNKGVHYYLYPDGVVEAYSSVDFVFHRWSDIKVEFNVVDISTLVVRPKFSSHSNKKSKKRQHTDALSTLYDTTRAQVVGALHFPELDQLFYVNRTGPAEDFAKAINEYKGV